MKNTYEKNDISQAKKKFAAIYIFVMFIILYITDIINKTSDISVNGLTALRSILLFIAILVLARILTKTVINKYQITKSYSDNLRFNINMVIIAVAIISLFYFLFVINSNIRNVKNTTYYKTASIFLTENEMDEVINEAGKQARKSSLIVWVSIMISSSIAACTEGKYIEKLCFDDGANTNESA